MGKVQRNPGFSRELQVGKAGEHFACFDLILQGYNAFLADAGLPYDVVVDARGKFIRVQVKSTRGPPKSYGKAEGVYRFGMRRSRGNRKRFDHGLIDAFAFVMLDARKIAYFRMEDLRTKEGMIKQTIDLRTRDFHYTGKRVYPTGRVREYWKEGRFLEDFRKFPF